MSGQGTDDVPPSITGADRLTRFGSQTGVSAVAPPRRAPSAQKEAVAEEDDDVDEDEMGDTFNKLPVVEEKSVLAGPGRLGSFPSRLRLSLVVNEGEQPTSQVGGARPRGGPKSLPSFKKSGASGIIGHSKTIRLSVLPVSGIQVLDQNQPSGVGRNNSRRGAPGEDGVVMPLQRTQSFTPLRLLDIENGAAILVTEPKFLPADRFQEIGDDGALVVVAARTTAPLARQDEDFFKDRGEGLQEKIRLGDIQALEAYREVGAAGRAWRGLFRRFMLTHLDEVNALRYGRILQFFIPFLTGYEAYLISQVIEVFDESPPKKKDVNLVLKIAFENRNVSRFLVRNALSRWDWFWHSYQAIINNRMFDAYGQLPFIGFTRFPATENFPSTRNHVISSIGRVVLGQGGWITRVLTQGRQGLNADNPDLNIAQNLAPEVNGSEAANRSQFGVYIGRVRTNAFRLAHRLPADETIVRTFIPTPLSTMVNNGAVHLLRQLSKHWNNLLNQPSGNFAHQRQEQLDPFETMRFHIPVICVVLSNLRGRNRWDSTVLGPFMKKCNLLKPTINAQACCDLAKEMKRDILLDLTAGVPSVYDPLNSLLDSIILGCRMIEEEAQEVYQKVTSVEIGLRLGHDLITQVHWKIPSDADLKKAILLHIEDKPVPASLAVNERRIRSALLSTTPRDKRTLIELVKTGHLNTKPAQLLLGRVKTLLQREIRREALNELIRELAVGDVATDLVADEWYWVEDGEKKAVYIYCGKVSGNDHRFIHVDSGIETIFKWKKNEDDLKFNRGTAAAEGVKCLFYIPVAEAITRAQRAYMHIELENGKRFKYNAFMEFSYLRIALRRLAVISQVYCEELDVARLNVLREVQRSNQTQIGIKDLEVGRTYYTYDNKTKSYEPFVCEKKLTPSDPEWNTLAKTKILTVPPQNCIVVGGGPTGLMAVIHLTEAVLTGGGVMKLFEARDAFYAGGATFERAQIVRLDARWIAMLRYYLGTGFEDVYIPSSGETDAQLGNVLPTQGFVEITIKDLENMLHVEVSRMWSKGLIQCFTNSKAYYDHATNSLIKEGQHLKIDDAIRRRVDPEGNRSSEYHSWKVVEFKQRKPLSIEELRAGTDYGVFLRQENAVVPMKLTVINLQSHSYTFTSLKEGVGDIEVTRANMPPVYPKGTRFHDEVLSVVIESRQKGKHGGYAREDLPMPVIKTEKFALDIGHSHVVECTGKQVDSKVHLSTTTYEPYGVCCIQGLKISMGMHNFGEKRFGTGLLDDFRSTNDQNTRIIGDFTKMVRQPRIAERMVELMDTKRWQTHFLKLIEASPFPSLDELDPIMPKLRKALQWHAHHATTFKRQTLQTRFFETGDNFYLGMEFTREYDKWKNETVDDILVSIKMKATTPEGKKNYGRLRGTLTHHIDRLWYEACLEVIAKGDVYNPGARQHVPQLYIIDSYEAVELRTLPVGEAFRVESNTKERYEILVKQGSKIVVRNVEGYITDMSGSTKVLREGNLTRGPDGNAESKVSLATFPVGHYVNYRTIRLNEESRGYVFAFIGDEQSTPHFMRYSGLTGACINCMLINEFVASALHGVPFKERLARYAMETDWSNSEVVTRGVGSLFGRDGFLRPGFPYEEGIKYLHAKSIERIETGQPLDEVLSRDWTAKFAAALVPKGMELNKTFNDALNAQHQSIIFNKFIDDVQKDSQVSQDGLVAKLMGWKDSMSQEGSKMDSATYWGDLKAQLKKDNLASSRMDFHIQVAQMTQQTVADIVEFAKRGYLYDDRIAGELFYQPKPVDTFVDDFAVEAQNLANSLILSAAFAAGAIAFSLFDCLVNEENCRGGSGDVMMPNGSNPDFASVFGALLGVSNLFISFDTMASVSRYKIRNEESRVLFFEERMQSVITAVFALLPRSTQQQTPEEANAYLRELDHGVETFRYHANYYGVQDPDKSGFNDAYNKCRKNFTDPAAIREFQSQLAGKFIADVYHVNSYIQEYLVDIYKICERIVVYLEREGEQPRQVDHVQHLFQRLNAFVPKLDHSLQRGHIRWGFIKKRRFAHWDIVVVFRYFYSLLFYASPKKTAPCAPIQTETLGIIRETKNLSKENNNTILRREIRDLEQLYWASRESDVASMIFVAVFCVHILSWIFTISRIISFASNDRVAASVTNAAAWATVASTFGAILSVFHFQRKLGILTRLWCLLGNKVSSAKTPEAAAAIRTVRTVTFTQVFLTFLRLIASYGSAVALPWFVAVTVYEEQVDLDSTIPVYIAWGAFGCAVFATLFFGFVEYRVRYDLVTRLGEYICEAFRDEIEEIYSILNKPMNDIQTKQEQDRETWEYVAREFLHIYRFDTVFAADRFGTILQYLQSGMVSRSSPKSTA